MFIFAKKMVYGNFKFSILIFLSTFAPLY